MSFWRWPGHWKPRSDMHLSAHLDVLPTLCELAGAEIPDTLRSKLDGFSLLPLLETEEAIEWHEDRLLFQHVARWPAGLAASHKHAMFLNTLQTILGIGWIHGAFATPDSREMIQWAPVKLDH